jgi:hypothetical protein
LLVHINQSPVLVLNVDIQFVCQTAHEDSTTGSWTQLTELRRTQCALAICPRRQILAGSCPFYCAACADPSSHRPCRASGRPRPTIRGKMISDKVEPEAQTDRVPAPMALPHSARRLDVFERHRCGQCDHPPQLCGNVMPMIVFVAARRPPRGTSGGAKPPGKLFTCSE